MKRPLFYSGVERLEMMLNSKWKNSGVILQGLTLKSPKSAKFPLVLKRIFRTILAASIFLSLPMLSGCEKYRLDQQVEELCKKDGGVKVYETVTLPPEMFDRWGDPFPGWGGRKPADRLGPDYRYIVEIEYLKRGDPIQLFSEGELRRYSEKIIRVSDGKLMGLSIVYGRTGGETILLGHPSSKRCPVYKNANETLIRSVFLKKGN